MRTRVKKIFHKGSASVVEWEDSNKHIRRTIIPSTEIVEENGILFVENVEEGPDFGVDWETLIQTEYGPKKIADLLRRRGIWTLEDYASNTPVITSVFNEACSGNLQRFRENVNTKGRQ